MTRIRCPFARKVISKVIDTWFPNAGVCVCVCFSCLREMKTSRRRSLGITNYLVKRSLVHWCVGAVNATIYIYALDSHTVVGYHSFQLMQMHKYSSKDDDEGHINASAKSCEIRLYQGMTWTTGCLCSGTKDQPGRLMPMICCLPTSIVKALDPDTPFLPWRWPWLHDTGMCAGIGFIHFILRFLSLLPEFAHWQFDRPLAKTLHLL